MRFALLLFVASIGWAESIDRLTPALAKAQEFWGKKADVRKVVFDFQAPNSFGQVGGRWEPATKTIHLNIQDWTDERLAIVVTHEYGHALGFKHSDNSRDVMFLYGPQALASSDKYGPSALDIKDMSAIGNFSFVTSCNNQNLVIGTDFDKPIVKVQLPESSCDWGQILGNKSEWSFRIEGKAHTLTGEQLAEAVKKAATPDK